MLNNVFNQSWFFYIFFFLYYSQWIVLVHGENENEYFIR